MEEIKKKNKEEMRGKEERKNIVRESQKRS